MKRFIFSTLMVSVFFLGVGALVERTGAKFKSDEKALDLVRKARVAIGGDAAIADVQSMLIVGRTTQTFKVNGADRTETGETEIAMQLPDKMAKTVKIGDGSVDGVHMINKQVDVVVVGDAKDKMRIRVDADGKGSGTEHTIVMKKDDGTVVELTGDDAVKWIAKEHPGDGAGERRIVMKKDDGTVVELTGEDAVKWMAKEHPGGEAGEHKIFLRKNADGTVQKTNGGDVERVIVRGNDGGNATFMTKDGKKMDLADKQFIFERSDTDAGNHHSAMRSNEMLRMTLSLLMSSPKGIDPEYTFGGTGNIDGRSCNIVVASFSGQSYKLFLDSSSNLPVAISYKTAPTPSIMHFEKAANTPADGAKDVTFLKRAAGPADQVDVQVRFSDYRYVNNVQLPFRWVQKGETFDITRYEINPANIGEKFRDQKVMVRTAKPDSK